MARKILLIILMCLLPLYVANAEPPLVQYFSDFHNGTDGWYGRGEKVTVSAKNNTLKVKKRTQDWNSPGRDFELQAGNSYLVSVEVKQNAVKNATFILSVAHTRNGVETYENLVLMSVKKGEWSRFSAQYDAGSYDRFVLYIETRDNPTIDFEIRNFSIQAFDDCYLVEGLECDRIINESHPVYNAINKLVVGKKYSNDYLSVTVTSKRKDEHNIYIHVKPHKAGLTTLEGVQWNILKRNKIPSELIGTWEFKLQDRGETLYYTFNKDGRVYESDTESMKNFACGDGLIRFSSPLRYNRKMYLKDGKPLICIGDSQLYSSKMLTDGKVQKLKSFSIDSFAGEKDGKLILLADTSGEITQEMAVPVNVWKNQSSVINGSLKAVSSDPDILASDAFYLGSAYIYGKKPGKAEVYLATYDKKPKTSNKLSFTVLEGKRTMPKKLTGKRWTHQANGETTSIIFDSKGRYFKYRESKLNEYMSINTGYYLYHDGIIQLDCHCWGLNLFIVEKKNDKNVLNCLTHEVSVNGYWNAEKILTGKNKCISGTYVFNDEGIPMTNGIKSSDILWWQYRTTYELKSTYSLRPDQ